MHSMYTRIELYKALHRVEGILLKEQSKKKFEYDYSAAGLHCIHCVLALLKFNFEIVPRLRTSVLTRLPKLPIQKKGQKLHDARIRCQLTKKNKSGNRSIDMLKKACLEDFRQ